VIDTNLDLLKGSIFTEEVRPSVSCFSQFFYLPSLFLSIENKGFFLYLLLSSERVSQSLLCLLSPSLKSLFSHCFRSVLPTLGYWVFTHFLYHLTICTSFTSTKSALTQLHSAPSPSYTYTATFSHPTMTSQSSYKSERQSQKLASDISSTLSTSTSSSLKSLLKKHHDKKNRDPSPPQLMRKPVRMPEEQRRTEAEARVAYLSMK
jgi:hypothetical protein